MMNNKYVFLGYVLAFILQPFIGMFTPVDGGSGNLVLCLTVVFAFLYENPVYIISFGVLFGLLSDIVYGLCAGPGALATALVCAVILVLKIFFNNKNYFNAAGLIAICTLLYHTIYWITYNMTGIPYTFMYSLRILPSTLIINMVVGMILYVVTLNKIKSAGKDRYLL